MRDRTHSPFTAVDRKKRLQMREAAQTLAKDGLKAGGGPMKDPRDLVKPERASGDGGTYNGKGGGTSSRDGVELLARTINGRMSRAKSGGGRKRRRGRPVDPSDKQTYGDWQREGTPYQRGLGDGRTPQRNV